MRNYVVDLEQFYGPLELLLYLVEKNQMDVYDIPVAEITRQYLEYTESMEKIDLDSLGDFLVMASYLLNLKSRLLLPQRAGKAENEDQDEGPWQDPREELAAMLVEYKRFKQAALFLEAKQMENGGRVFFRESSLSMATEEELSGSLSSLARAYAALARKTTSEDILYFPMGDIDIGEKMVEILTLMEKAPAGASFAELLRGSRSRREAAVFFLALLELVRMNRVEAVQDLAFGRIEIFPVSEDVTAEH